MRISGDTPRPSKDFPALVRYSSVGNPNVHPFGNFRPHTSENTPWVFSPADVTRGVLPMRAIANVSPPLSVSGPINSATLPRYPGRVETSTQAGCGAVKRRGPLRLFRVTFESARYFTLLNREAIARHNGSAPPSLRGTATT